MKKRHSSITNFCILFIFSFSVAQLYAQNDVIMQGFYWEPPVDAANFNGSWWDSLAEKSGELSIIESLLEIIVNSDSHEHHRAAAAYAIECIAAYDSNLLFHTPSN